MIKVSATEEVPAPVPGEDDAAALKRQEQAENQKIALQYMEGPDSFDTLYVMRVSLAPQVCTTWSLLTQAYPPANAHALFVFLQQLLLGPWQLIRHKPRKSQDKDCRFAVSPEHQSLMIMTTSI